MTGLETLRQSVTGARRAADGGTLGLELTLQSRGRPRKQPE